MIVPSNNRVKKFFFLLFVSAQKFTRNQSTRFRLCSSLSIRSIHRVQTLWYSKFIVKILSTRVLETSKTISHMSLTFKRRTHKRLHTCNGLCSAHRWRLLGPPKIFCITSWRFWCCLDRMQSSVSDEFQWMKVMKCKNRITELYLKGAAIVLSTADGSSTKTERRSEVRLGGNREKGNTEHDSVARFCPALHVRKRYRWRPYFTDIPRTL